MKSLIESILESQAINMNMSTEADVKKVHKEIWPYIVRCVKNYQWWYKEVASYKKDGELVDDRFYGIADPKHPVLQFHIGNDYYGKKIPFKKRDDWDVIDNIKEFIPYGWKVDASESDDGFTVTIQKR